MKEALLQVRLEAELKQKAEELYAHMGMTLSQAVRVFVTQSVEDNHMPFIPHLNVRAGECRAFGALRHYRNPALQNRERDAWVSSLSHDASEEPEGGAR